jgi:tRNA modification GTPase
MTAYSLVDTIVAPATGLVRSAVGMLRLSGPDAWRVMRELCGGLPDAPRARRAYVVSVTCRPACATDEPVQPGLHPTPMPLLETGVLTLWHGPRSYTGEDMAELSLHGNPLLLALVQHQALDTARRLGLPLRPAEAGEFTYRAYLHGKLDLAQAEAVQQVIGAASLRALELAQSQLAGSTSRRVRSWVDRLVQLLARIEVTHDYGADDLDATLDPALLLTPAQVQDQLAALCAELAQAQDEARAAAQLRSGITVAICGPPNVGKSTLFNALLGQERALTAPEPGTTRDYLTEPLEADGLRLVLVDTAGYRDAVDAVEAAGVRLAGDWAQAADVLLWVTAADAADEANLVPTGNALCVVTRCDLLPHWPGAEEGQYRVSGRTGRGVAELRAGLQARAGALGDAPLDSLTQRQASQAGKAQAVLEAAQEALTSGLPLDAAAQDMYAGITALRQIYEHPDREAVVQAVFSGFCVGK